MADTFTPSTTLSGRPALDEQQPVVATRVRRGPSRASVVVFTLFLVGVLVTAGLAFLGGGPTGTDVRDMQLGQCYTETDTVQDGGRAIPFGSDTPCTTAAPRIVGLVHLPLGPFPGADGLNRIVADRCGGEQDRIVAPTAQTWAAGDRTVVCIALPE